MGDLSKLTDGDEMGHNIHWKLLAKVKIAGSSKVSWLALDFDSSKGFCVSAKDDFSSYMHLEDMEFLVYNPNYYARKVSGMADLNACSELRCMAMSDPTWLSDLLNAAWGGIEGSQAMTN